MMYIERVPTEPERVKFSELGNSDAYCLSTLASSSLRVKVGPSLCVLFEEGRGRPVVIDLRESAREAAVIPSKIELIRHRVERRDRDGGCDED